MNTYILNNARYAFVAALMIAVLGTMSYFAFEPTLGHAIDSNDFVVSATVVNEISFNVQPTDVSLVGTLNGLTGGYATGTTVTSINTNNSSGYTMTLAFENNGAHAMTNGTDFINDYSQAGSVPDYDWVDPTTGNPAEFGFTARASTSGEIATGFQNNGSNTCGTGSTETDNKCWASPTTTGATDIIVSSAPAVGGSSTTTLKFKVAIPNAPSPALPSGIYTATGTLTATTN